MKQIAGIFLPSTDTYFSQILERNGAFEPGRLDIALKYVKNFRVALDIGAHVGLRSRELAPIFPTVFSFEPTLATFSCLVRNMESFANVVCCNYALGSHSGEVSMIESSTRPGNSGSFFCTWGKGIDLRTLDSFDFHELDFLKIDTEGFESYVIEGGKETIQRCHPVIFMEEKNFKDRQGRMNIDYRAAGLLLENWGMRRIEQIKNDVIFCW